MISLHLILSSKWAHYILKSDKTSKNTTNTKKKSSAPRAHYEKLKRVLFSPSAELKTSVGVDQAEGRCFYYVNRNVVWHAAFELNNTSRSSAQRDGLPAGSRRRPTLTLTLSLFVIITDKSRYLQVRAPWYHTFLIFREL